MPSARFWLGQMMNHTLNAITKAIHIPAPISWNPGCIISASFS